MNLIYKKLIRPLLFQLDAEHAHDLACRFLKVTEKSSLARKCISLASYAEYQSCNVFGLSFPNSLGLAAGMDKNGTFPKTFSSLRFWPC